MIEAVMFWSEPVASPVLSLVIRERRLVFLALLAAAAVLVPARRLRGPGRGVGRGRRPRRWVESGARRTLVAGGVVAVAGVLLGVPPWLVAVLAVGAAVAEALSRMPRRRPDSTSLRDLAGTFDLLATCLDAGMPMGGALTAVLGCLGGPPRSGADPGRRQSAGSHADPATVLAEVAALLGLGADAQTAWQPAVRHPELAELAAAATRSATGGLRLADAVRESADGLRRRGREVDARRSARAGVAMTAPLGLCFLPAFLCLGLAPVVIGLLTSLHIW